MSGAARPQATREAARRTRARGAPPRRLTCTRTARAPARRRRRPASPGERHGRAPTAKERPEAPDLGPEPVLQGVLPVTFRVSGRVKGRGQVAVVGRRTPACLQLGRNGSASPPTASHAPAPTPCPATQRLAGPAVSGPRTPAQAPGRRARRRPAQGVRISVPLPSSGPQPRRGPVQEEESWALLRTTLVAGVRVRPGRPSSLYPAALPSPSPRPCGIHAVSSGVGHLPDDGPVPLPRSTMGPHSTHGSPAPRKKAAFAQRKTRSSPLSC